MLSKLLILRSRVRKIITATICKYLDCGIMENGFARVRCPNCGYDFFVAFSCKTRFFCPSCAEKRTLIWGAWVKENVLKGVAHRQWVFTIPKVLRKLFYKDRMLLSELARCAAATILELYKAIFPDNHFRPGIIALTQTFGDLLIWHLSACRTGRSAHSLLSTLKQISLLKQVNLFSKVLIQRSWAGHRRRI